MVCEGHGSPEGTYRELCSGLRAQHLVLRETPRDHLRFALRCGSPSGTVLSLADVRQWFRTGWYVG